MPEEQFDVVDQQDRVLSQAPRSVVHANKWLHRAAHIFVFNSRGELLVHRRSATKDECPNVCTSSASGHLAAGEDYATAAVRELEEELGLNSPVEFLGIIPANGAETSFEHSGLFRTTTDQPPIFDPGEIVSGEFLPLDEVAARLERDPHDFTPCFRTLFRWYCSRVPPRLARITIYPLKAFAPVVVEDAVVLPNGALQHDRQFALVDPSGRFLNAKRTTAVHGLVLELDPKGRTLTASRRSEAEAVCWDIDLQRDELHRWLSDYFSLDVLLIEEPDGGFPDDNDATGPTIVSVATLRAVAEWFPGLTLDDVRRRFRANLEVDGVEPFWEDRLYRADSTAQPFRIGSALFEGTNPCQRCVVPSRDPTTGEVWPEFARRFAELRERHLPAWAARERFNHFYRLTTNTRGIGSSCGLIRVGDMVEL